MWIVIVVVDVASEEAEIQLGIAVIKGAPITRAEFTSECVVAVDERVVEVTQVN